MARVLPFLPVEGSHTPERSLSNLHHLAGQHGHHILGDAAHHGAVNQRAVGRQPGSSIKRICLSYR
ncbi:hypothetical protein B0T18DRAFT_417264 [Schizothecium vesticola]|uniref:Uncharacterized protein n=1 Tax=Schizothecium vesticola TaxID=314040 RepID=A0AA40BTJ2_9PEZI|nr:hypothetical protein B0T18DRAFT_417264 [Schizothecium vesticola]